MGAKGITFKETMTGPFSLGVSDPADGARNGRDEQNNLVMNASVTIDDLDGFLSDVSHLGALTGSIDFLPLGTGIHANRGKFNLFSPDKDANTRFMVYELEFHHSGSDYYLAGRKCVRDDPGFDLIKDTTTLFTKLHDGLDANGKVLGAGILTLGVTDLVELLKTVRVTGAKNNSEKIQTVSRFGSFFAGQLWDVYGP